MGLYFRYPAAFLIALLAICSSTQLHAATRKYVSLPSNGSVVGSGSAARSGDSLIITGQPLDGEYIPSSYGGGSKGTKLPIKPKYDYSIPRTLKGMTTTLRGGVVGIGLSIGLQYMLDAVDGIIEDGQVKVRRPPEPVSGGFVWYIEGIPDKTYLSAELACDDFYQSRIQYGASSKTLTIVNAQGTCKLYRSTGSLGWSVGVIRQGQSCPTGTAYDGQTGACVGPGQYSPATDADFDLMEAAANAKDSEWLKDRLREHCEGSLSPESCYEELRTSTQLDGPSTVTETGPTTTTTGPGGTTSSTTNTRIDITYGDNYYDYRKTSTVTKTNPDGTTETETTTDPEEVTEEQEQDEGAIEYSDADMPEVQPFYQQKYPDGLAGVWSNVSSDIESSAFLAFLSSFVPNFSGSCPTFSLQFNIASWANYGTISFWNMCWIFEFIKTVLIVSAVFLARALTFGG